jgi:hypothetical protein
MSSDVAGRRTGGVRAVAIGRAIELWTPPFPGHTSCVDSANVQVHRLETGNP